MQTESSKQNCPKCGAPIPPEAPQGLCPACVLGGAVTPVGPERFSDGKVIAPPLEEVAAAFPNLEILEFIGQGGMGMVYKARQPKLDRVVALKLLPKSMSAIPTFAERFHREARFLARLTHSNIVSVFEFGVSGGFCFLLMEFVDGLNMRQAMRAGRFSPAEALAIVPRICDALQYAHDQGVLHRDIKPENILIDARGHVKIADFGIAKLVGDPRTDITLTVEGARLGTPHYMAPEQIEKPGDVDHRADIYSLGVVFYELLTGELPLGRFLPPSEKVDMDARIDQIVFRALAKERELRQQSAGEVRSQVDDLKTPIGDVKAASMIKGASMPSKPVATPVDRRRWSRYWLLLAMGACLFILSVDMAMAVRGLTDTWAGVVRSSFVGSIALIAVGGFLASLIWRGWQQREEWLTPVCLALYPGRGEAGLWFQRLLLVLLGQIAFLVVARIWVFLGGVIGVSRPGWGFFWVAVVGPALFSASLWRSAGAIAPPADPTEAPAWARRAGYLFLAIGGIALLPSFLTWRGPIREWHPASMLSATGIALLTWNGWWRKLALTANAFGLFVGLGNFAAIAWLRFHNSGEGNGANGAFATPFNAPSALLFCLLQTLGFVAGLRALLRPDALRAFSSRLSSSVQGRRKSAVIAAMGLSCFALGLLFMTGVIQSERSIELESPRFEPSPEPLVVSSQTGTVYPVVQQPPENAPAGSESRDLMARLNVYPPGGQMAVLRFSFWSNGLPIAVPGHGTTLTGNGPLPVRWLMRAGLEKGSWEISNALLGDAPQPAHAMRFLMAPNVILQVPSANIAAQPGPGERLRRWLLLPAEQAADATPPARPMWGISVDVEALEENSKAQVGELSESVPENK